MSGWKWSLKVILLSFAWILGLGQGVAFGAVRASAVSDSLAITQEQIFFLPMQRKSILNVLTAITVRNSSHVRQFIAVRLPAGYQKLTVLGEKNAEVHTSGMTFVLPTPVAPLQSQRWTYSYQLPWSPQSGSNLVIHTNYPVYAAHLYAPLGENIALSAQDVLVSTQTVQVASSSFRVFTRLGIPAGDNWHMSLGRLPDTAAPAATQGLPILGTSDVGAGNTLQAIGNLVLAGFILILVLISVRRTKRLRYPLSGSTIKYDELLDSLESLEIEHICGNLDDDAYETKRSELVSKWVRLKYRAQSAKKG